MSKQQDMKGQIHLKHEGFIVSQKLMTGILLPVFSLPGDFGIGCFGVAAKRWIDQLQQSGMNAWQICPLGPTGFGNSPYQPLSEFALNPLFIDIEDLYERGWLRKDDIKNAPIFPANQVDYETLVAWKQSLLLNAYERFLNCGNTDDFEQFKTLEGEDLEVFATFCALKIKFGGQPWWKWSCKYRKYQENAVKEYQQSYSKFIDFFKFGQWILTQQWAEILNYAQEKGVDIIGDIPLYVGLDSATVWQQRSLFDWNDADDCPKNVAGVPPDYFSCHGQLWGNPVYDWEMHEKTKFAWWCKRIRKNLLWFNKLRIDHFRGLYDYWSIPWGQTTARCGQWKLGPQDKFFKVLRQFWPEMPFILEDLGDLNEGVKVFQKQLNLPGMAVLQFAFEGENNPYLPQHWQANQFVYTGTHDNDTTQGWFDKLDESCQKHICTILGGGADVNHMGTTLVRWALKCRTTQHVIIPMQDIFNLGSWARINTPGTLGSNWCWRCSWQNFNAFESHVKYIYE